MTQNIYIKNPKGCYPIMDRFGILKPDRSESSVTNGKPPCAISRRVATYKHSTPLDCIYITV